MKREDYALIRVSGKCHINESLFHRITKLFQKFILFLIYYEKSI